MDNYIKAVEEIGFVKNEQQSSPEHISYHQKGVQLVIQVWPSYTNIFTSKSIKDTEKSFNVFHITEPQIPTAIRSIVRFWARNGVRLGKEKK